MQPARKTCLLTIGVQPVKWTPERYQLQGALNRIHDDWTTKHIFANDFALALQMMRRRDTDIVEIANELRWGERELEATALEWATLLTTHPRSPTVVLRKPVRHLRPIFEAVCVTVFEDASLLEVCVARWDGLAQERREAQPRHSMSSLS